MKDNQLRWGSILSYVQIVVNVLIGLLYTPVMLKLLGQSEYGLYNTVSSTIAMLNVLSLGFNSSYIRYYARYAVQKDTRRINSLNGIFLIVFTIIGLIALVCGLFLTSHLELVFDQGLTASEYATAKVLMLILTVNLAISFPMSTFTSIISAHERYVFLKLMGIVKTVISPLLTLPLLLAGYGSVAMVVITTLVTLLMDAVYFFYARKKLEMRFAFHGFEKGILRNLLVYSSFIAINIVVDQINSNMDKFLLGRFVGTEEVAVYAIGYTLYHYYMFFSLGVSSVFSPRIHRIVNSTQLDSPEQKRQLTKLFVRVGRIQYLILALVATGFFFFGRQFIVMWTDSEYGNSYYVALLLIFSATVPFIQNVGIEIQRALNRHVFSSICYLMMALVNLAVSIELCQRFGAVGSAAGTALAFVLANGLIMNVYYHKRCNIDILYFWRCILRMSLGLILPLITGALIVQLWDCYKPIPFLLGIPAYTLVYCCSMWLFGLDKEEKQKIISGIRRKLHH